MNIKYCLREELFSIPPKSELIIDLKSHIKNLEIKIDKIEKINELQAFIDLNNNILDNNNNFVLTKFFNSTQYSFKLILKNLSSEELSGSILYSYMNKSLSTNF